MKKIFRILLWTLVAVLFIGTFVYLYLNSRPATVEYNTAAPSRMTIEKTTVLTGKIEPRDEINIKPQISGIISEVLVEAGDMVNTGDVIARIKVIPEASSLSSAQNRVESARIALEDARRKNDRARMLLEKKVISREEAETAETQFRQAERELSAAEDAYRIVNEGVSALNADESNTMVRSTITGLVLDVPVKVGSSVIQANTFNDGTTIATVADMRNLIFKGNVDETEVGLLSPGMEMEVTVGAMPDLRPVAVLEFIAPKGTEVSGAKTFEIKGSVVVPDTVNVRSGYSANAKVLLSRAADVLAVPEGVVEFAGDSTFVYILADSVARTWERVPVTTGMSDGVNIEIKQGIDSTAVLRSTPIVR